MANTRKPKTESAPTATNGTETHAPPYEGGNWKTIIASAKYANVTPQTIRNAIKANAFDGHLFRAPLVDQFGNTSDQPVVYIDLAAIDSWLADPDRGKNKGGRKSDGLVAVTLRVSSQLFDTIKQASAGQIEMVNLSGVKLVERKARTPKAASEAPVAAVEQSDLFNVEV